MSKISLSDLAQRLAEKSGISQQDAELFIRKMFDVANEGLQSDKLVKMKWLGTFKVMAVKDRESVDVNTGERIIIEGRDKISFTPDNILKEIVNKPFAQFETVVVNDGVDFDEIDRKFENVEEEDSEAGNAAETLADIEKVPSSESVSASENISASGNIPASEGSSVVSFEEYESPETSGVIDFLDEENDAPVSDEMIVIGEELPQENVAESEEKEPEVSEFAATEPAVFKPEVSELATSESEEMESEVPAQDEVEPVVSDDAKESTLTEETPIAENIPSVKENSITENPIAEKASSDEETPIKEETPIAENAPSDEETSSAEETDKRHIVLPRSLVIAASVVFLAMIGGFGWFAFNYGKIAAQRDHLAMQLDNYQQTPTEKKAPAKSVPTQEEILRKKAIEDSVRMAQASEAVKKAENAEQNMDAAADNQSIDVKSAEAKKNLEAKKLEDTKKLVDAKKQAEAKKKLADAKKLAETKKLQEAKKLAEAKKKEEARKQAEKHAAQTSSKYDQDARVRTGAYRIIGVSEVVTAREGQSIKSLSQKYLGPGMECYVEALNGTSQLKPGQKVKIPKLELKKKK